MPAAAAPPTTPAKILARQLTWHRGPIVYGEAARFEAAPASSDPAAPPAQPAPLPRIEPKGGKFGAGIIRGFAVATQGEALGHGVWLDSEFIQATAAAINAAPDGQKSRFTHPSLSADGLGTFLGRATNATVSPDGRQVFADLHIDPTAHATPKGNLAEYAMKLADTDPKAFGASIVFKPDGAAMKAHQQAHSRPAQDESGRPVRVFFSPDPANTGHLPHARLAQLRAVDVVDSPAANPGGMFAADPLLDSLDSLAAYAVGLTDEAPAETALDADPDRLREYLDRFLTAHGLAITKTKPAEADNRESLAASLAQFRDRFGPERAAHYLIGRGLNWTEALDAYAVDLAAQLAAGQLAAKNAVDEALAKQNAAHAEALAAAKRETEALAKQVADLTARLAAIPTGLAKPLSQIDPAAAPASSDPGQAGRAGLSPAAARYAMSLTLPATKPAAK